MRICVIGSGIAGLTCALRLSGHKDVEITVLERAGHFGGRADVDAGGEHCPRFFMDDYAELLAILDTIEGPGGGSVRSALREVRRLALTSTSGWVEISHVYRVLAREIPLGERIGLARRWRPTPLVAGQPGQNANRYGTLRDYSPRGLSRMVGNLARSKTAYALPGPTDLYLIDPWVRELRGRGVVLTAGRGVQRLERLDAGLLVTTAAGAEPFDVVVVTAFVPDLLNLLDASRIDHTGVDTDNTHCVGYTIELDPREKVMTTAEPMMYSHSGLNILVQPLHARCVVLCTLSSRTDQEYVVDRVRDYLALEYDLLDVRCRPNQRPGEAVYVGDYLRPERLLRRPVPGLYFAGSAMHNSYPLDAAEGATRSALGAVRAIRHDYDLGTTR